MLSDSIRRWNPWWAEGKLKPETIGVKREKLAEIENSLNTRQIKGTIGPRRSGKTTLLYQVIDSLLQQGISPQNILMLNFDDSDIYNSDFELLLSECKKINPNVTHLFLDEVQERKDWERWVRTLYDTRQFLQIFITGSSSSLLSRDVSHVLTGRHITFYTLPFSFREYLVFSGWSNFGTDYLKHNKGEILHHLHKYLKRGGYPETLKMDEMNKNRYLNNLFEDIVARDIVGRHGVDYHMAKRVAYYVVSHSSKTMTYRGIAKACGIAVDTASKYLDYMHESRLIYPLRVFSFKLKEQMRETNKYYVVDTGLADAVSFRFSEDIGRTAECAVYLELLRRYEGDPKTELYYWKDKTGKEVDFLVKKGEKVEQALQVCWDVSEEKTKKREVSGLIKALDEFALQEGGIITENYEQHDIVEGKNVRFIPLWKWLLEKD